MSNSISILDEDETKDALSLNNSPTIQSAPPSEPPSEFFEFFSADTNLSHAEYIIFCGKLIPLKSQDFHVQARDCNGVDLMRIRETSSPKSKYATHPNSPKSKKMMMTSSKSLDYQKLRRSFSSDFRSASIRSGSQKVHKPRWYSMIFRLVSKTPPEMELRDMKNRLVRRTPSAMFPQSDCESICQAKRNQHESAWGLLISVLSCKDNASVGVTPSLGAYSRATCA